MNKAKKIIGLMEADPRILGQEKKAAMDYTEMTNIIYDTLMKNPQHPQLDIDKVTNQTVDAQNGYISFNYESLYVEVRIGGKKE